MRREPGTMVGPTTGPRPLAIYLWTIITFGLAVIVHSGYSLALEPPGYHLLVLAGLTIISGSANIKLPSVPATISISETFIFASVLLLGTPAGTLIVAVDGLVMSCWQRDSGSRSHRTLFNVSTTALSVWIGSNIFFWTSGLSPLVDQPAGIGQLLFPLILFAAIYFTLNSWIIATAIGLEKGVSPVGIWTNSFVWVSLSYLSGASVAAFLVIYSRDLDLTMIGAIVPLLLVLYLTFRTAMGRIEDANQHLAQMNALYLSTVEALALAIDARDQITHGHIRRVQTYALGLARKMGLSDRDPIMALEAAALLHDMGKLAVPEHILNKPGKLTAAESERMKLHASVGADILSSVDLPFPVVPIVRHHHENWDGSGYPTGLTGCNIPIGARILAVVDCFDALTSDRPYRPRLSDGEALRILQERRGHMYDPDVVDTFARVHREIAPSPAEVDSHSRALSVLTRSVTPTLTTDWSTQTLAPLNASAEEILSLSNLTQGQTAQTGLADTGDIIARHLGRIVPMSLCTFYIYDPSRDDLVAAHSYGEPVRLVRGLRIRLGERLSGWVGANRQTIVNSDPILDLGHPTESLRPTLRSSLGVPLIASGKLVGVLTLYAIPLDAFSEDHRRIVEVVARQLAPLIEGAVELDTRQAAGLRDKLTGLTNRRQLQRFVASDRRNSTGRGDQMALIFLGINSLNSLNEDHRPHVADMISLHVSAMAQRALRGADILFRYHSEGFVAVLQQTDAGTSDLIAGRIRDQLSTDPIVLPDGLRVSIEPSIGIVTSPADGTSVDQLIALAKARSLSIPTMKDERVNFDLPVVH